MYVFYNYIKAFKNINMNTAKTTTSPKGDTESSLHQKQLSPTNELLRSFKATTNLANGLTKERIKIQNEF